jgi:hypothetical protein
MPRVAIDQCESDRFVSTEQPPPDPVWLMGTEVAGLVFPAKSTARTSNVKDGKQAAGKRHGHDPCDFIFHTPLHFIVVPR